MLIEWTWLLKFTVGMSSAPCTAWPAWKMWRRCDVSHWLTVCKLFLECPLLLYQLWLWHGFDSGLCLVEPTTSWVFAIKARVLPLCHNILGFLFRWCSSSTPSSSAWSSGVYSSSWWRCLGWRQKSGSSRCCSVTPERRRKLEWALLELTWHLGTL